MYATQGLWAGEYNGPVWSGVFGAHCLQLVLYAYVGNNDGVGSSAGVMSSSMGGTKLLLLCVDEVGASVLADTLLPGDCAVSVLHTLMRT